MKKSWIHRGTVLIQVGRPHMAFLRGYLGGLDLGEMASRYLEGSIGSDPDLRVAKSQLRWIREQLVIAAHRRGREFRDARLIQIDPEKLKYVRQQPTMSLDQFREERDPYEMMSEAELLELFQEEFGGTIDRRAGRNDRLRRRQLAALLQLEQLLAADPTPGDGVDGWLDPALAERLLAVDIKTLRDLVEWINTHGYRWWNYVPKVGEKAALQITAWLKSDYVVRATGLHIAAHASVPARLVNRKALMAALPRQTGIVPFERFLVPSALSGEHGSNRGVRCRLNANNDYEAIHEWLRVQPENSHTARAYRKEAERYLLWSIIELGKPISDQTSADCVSYRTFLKALNPEAKGANGDAVGWPFRVPREAWIGPNSAERFSDDWRPFAGPLSPQSQQQAIVIVRALCTWLVGRRYLDSNPWEGVPKGGHNKARRFDRTRSFTFFQWKVLLRYLDTLPKDEKYHRLRFVLFFAYATGLRISELVRARAADITEVFDVEGTTQAWEVEVFGKGSVTRKVPMPSRVLLELNRYLSSRNLAPVGECAGGTPLIAQLASRGRPSKAGPAAALPPSPPLLSPPTLPCMPAITRWSTPMSEKALYTVLKGFFGGAAASIEHLDDHTRARFRKASAHWLRHTCGTHAVASGIPIQVVQANFGHASPDTTAGYVEPDNLSRARAMESFLETRMGEFEKSS